MSRKRKARELTVTAADRLTPNMRRLTLRGDALGDFPDDAEGAYFKLVFPGADSDRPTLRTYTVARHRPEDREIDVDFMLHGDEDGVDGVASSWAARVAIGAPISLFGPGPATFVNTDGATWYLLAADMTALPALTANLSRLPADARGHVVVEILTERDRQALAVPDGVEVSWVVNPEPGADDAPLDRAVRALAWPDGRASVWAACEFGTMKRLRRYFREVRGVEKSHLYVSSYWKRGLGEEEHKLVKREDAATA